MIRWTWRRRQAPSPVVVPASLPQDRGPHAALLDLAEAVLRCRTGFPADVRLAVTLTDKGSGLVSVSCLLPCNQIFSVEMRPTSDTPEGVPVLMGALLAQTWAHMRACPETPLDIGPVEIRVGGEN